MARPPSSARPILCAVLDGDALGPDPRGLAEALFAAGVDWIQLRDRSREADALLALARSLVAARGPRVDGGRRVIVNKRADIALAAGADGVHLGIDALDPRSTAALAPGNLCLGVSLHGLGELEALAATDEPIHSVHLAPIWSPRSKPAERPALGTGILQRAAGIAARAGLALLAQGGLDPARAAEAIAAGAAGIAVTGDLSQAGDPPAAARALRRALDAQATGA